MPRSRGTEMPQRQSPRGPHQLRTTSSSESDPLHHRPITDRSPKLGGDRRSPRGQSEPMNQKKLGTRIADLESHLGQAQEELKILKQQLASAEAAKKEAQEELEKKNKKTTTPAAAAPPDAAAKIQEKKTALTEIQIPNKTDSCKYENFNDSNLQETDVYEVQVEKATTVEAKVKVRDDYGGRLTEPEKLPPSVNELALKDDEIASLKVKLVDKEKQMEVISQENESLKSQINEENLKLSSAKAKEEEMNSRLKKLGQELEETKENASQLGEKLRAVEGTKEELEAEMKKLRVQTEQWRKAADAAAAVLADGRRISERCGSMDKQQHFGFEQPRPVGGFVGSPGFGDDSDDGFGTKRKGSGIRMFGDLWKKKGQK